MLFAARTAPSRIGEIAGFDSSGRTRPMRYFAVLWEVAPDPAIGRASSTPHPTTKAKSPQFCIFFMLVLSLLFMVVLRPVCGEISTHHAPFSWLPQLRFQVRLDSVMRLLHFERPAPDRRQPSRADTAWAVAARAAARLTPFARRRSFPWSRNRAIPNSSCSAK